MSNKGKQWKGWGLWWEETKGMVVCEWGLYSGNKKGLKCFLAQKMELFLYQRSIFFHRSAAKQNTSRFLPPHFSVCFLHWIMIERVEPYSERKDREKLWVCSLWVGLCESIASLHCQFALPVTSRNLFVLNKRDTWGVAFKGAPCLY